MKSILNILFLVLAFAQVQAQNAVQISPQKPQRGQTVTITYDPSAKGALIGADAKDITAVFTYSTFYDLPWRMLLKKEGNLWKASFVVQRYATFATFYLQSGTQIDQPDKETHYHLAIYADDQKRVKSGYLHESYSLSAQKPKSVPLAPLRLALLNKELSDYPDNYEAKVARLNVLMNSDTDPAKRLAYREEAHKIIAQKLESDPTSQGNMNSVTMAYLMIGEKTRVDSVRRVIRERFPQSDLGKDLTVSIIAREKDPKVKIQKLQALLGQSDDPKKDGSNAIHSTLFETYVSIGDSAKAIYHANKMLKQESPYLPKTYKEIAETLTQKQLAPGAALGYIQQSLAKVNQWPVGIIRFFPEYGYIPSFVADTVREQAVADAKAELLALAAINNLRLGKSAAAVQLAKESVNTGNDRTALLNAAQVLESTQQPQQAFDALWKVLLKNPSDTVALKAAKKNFLAANQPLAEFEKKVKQLEQLELQQLTQEIGKKVLNKPMPELTGLVDLQGKAVTAADLKGKVVILNFWATWCVPCMQEMPYFQQVYNRYKDHPKVKFMVVNSGANNTIKDAQKWAKDNTQYTFPIYFNNDKNIGEKVGFTVIPTIAVLDQEGKLQFRTIGFEGAILEKKLPIQIDMLLK
ncbi:TlpA family protein disulfide reductase [Pedobacter chitinilyticus]|uniref:TlpA family protein disulfide reductase n=1 Tax=Pedobacter chitinilyticus TaxID=2233776 RepID=A0A443Z279_9SPHI|nr:TlpA disulfide reductase family protein [Pedobacter chitinilyticus]RWU10622.1 TlpA family protein disulfide reductase [Pedobacter chitinilyticus]